jgi:hypothetical protein
MTLEEFVNSLNLPIEGKYLNNEYRIQVNSSNEFAQIFDSIALNTNLNALDDSIATEDETLFIYTDGYFEVRLEADYNKDVYSITVGER